ncbi:6,7-dimethyl-8-ribityllumazine synthase [Limibacterium fermenti]|jgi:6,7-dimethyl-8-ribityllumazine synthase|uniref:6,7-dimethyl-8-ribityllumazine synthase n=1 Tax=Limibacterium fermenti TaxID=3229863 RepID=UPI000E9AC8AF|nr:6,7-dimethyl-8-ribityllumazine synthase [Porphyromonadaceae bacterium]HBX21824.1 6,7-dimethyl-8-ribityllumazine synthase [Porphyromonadaceae bacterium]HBX44760.1 6,7-dimethyl-8-ribityllumazine synthase [Porphyromonadaceae bacterium]HCM21821.1 6,7-dimethyl-8-ribityllumazine synthase [Porphyromonadaceae bacterium]
MATALQNLSSYDPNEIPDGKGKRIGIVVSDWNTAITGNLLQGAYETLTKFGVNEEDIILEHVPGSFELTYGGKLLIEKSNVDAVILLGCVIQGETPHFTFVCNSVTQGTTQLNLNYNIPIIFGLLTTLTFDQAKARAGGRYGNKGDEAAITALKMIALNTKYK